jgi:hypothetical protein
MTDVLVASFGSAQVAAVRVGCRAGTEVQAIVSGLFTSSFALGNFCGPTISGIEGQEAGKDITYPERLPVYRLTVRQHQKGGPFKV